MLLYRVSPCGTSHLAKSRIFIKRIFRLWTFGCRENSNMSHPLVVRNVQPEEFLSLSFVYANTKLRMKERKFNFLRRRSEPLDVVKIRIVANIQREIDKKIRRMSKKKTAACDVEDSQASGSTFTLVERSTSGQIDLNVDVFLGMTGDEKVSGETPCDIAFIDGSRLQVGETTYIIIVNPPTIKSISLSSYLMTGFAVRPKLDVEFSEPENCVFLWYRSSNVMKSGCLESTDVKTFIPKDWEPLGSCNEYVPSDADIGRFLRVICTPPGTKWHPTGEPSEAVSKVAVVVGPGHCPFEDRHRHTGTVLIDHSSFRCVSYNILADVYADSEFSQLELFPYCPPHALTADYRTQLLVKEITGYNSDLVCLQEVDEKLFKNCLKHVLSSGVPNVNAMDGIFDLKGGKVAEGLALFYRTTKFRLAASKSIVLAVEVQCNPLFANYMNTLEKNENLKQTFLQRTTIFQVSVFEFINDPSRVLVVGNTHLYFRPDRDNIRLLQAGVCLEYLEQMVLMERCIRGADARVAAMFCGDFNSSPPFGVYQLITKQFVLEDHADWSSNENEIVRGLCLRHSLQLLSACGEPRYTNFTSGFADCIDYIFIDAGLLKISQAVPMPSEAQLRAHTALPSVHMPSDHVALIADISWID